MNMQQKFLQIIIRAIHESPIWIGFSLYKMHEESYRFDWSLVSFILCHQNEMRPRDICEVLLTDLIESAAIQLLRKERISSRIVFHDRGRSSQLPTAAAVCAGRMCMKNGCRGQQLPRWGVRGSRRPQPDFLAGQLCMAKVEEMLLQWRWIGRGAISSRILESRYLAIQWISGRS
jgi:hypothetical protein